MNSDFTFEDCLFGNFKLTKNADPDKYIYCGFAILFHSSSESSLPVNCLGKNVIIFRVDSSSIQIDNKKKDILILGMLPTQGLDDILLTAEAQYSINILR